MKDIPLPPLSRSHIFGRRAARWMSLRSPPSARTSSPSPLHLGGSVYTKVQAAGGPVGSASWRG